MNVKHTIAASLIGILLFPAAGLAGTVPVPGALRESIQREAFRLAQAGTPRAGTPQANPPAPAKQRSWAARHPIALGMILGIVAGGTFAQIADGRATDSDGRPVFLNGAVPGLVIGFSIGAIVDFTQD